VAGQDFLWPSSQIALELFKERGGKFTKAEVLFNSPIVLYSWQPVTQALIRAGIVRKLQESYYIVDFPKLIRLISEGKPWKEIGLPQLYGRVSLVCTDPTRSNSGNQFAGLLANMLNGGEVVDEVSVKTVLPGVKRFFGRLGYMQQSSGDLFTQFLQQGIGSYPVIVGYEAQLIEFSLANPSYRDLLQKEITTLYPQPTVWSSHPLIALTPNGERLLTALQDANLQRLAWEKHGFRTGLVGVQNDPKALPVRGVPATIENVIPMPKPQVMEKIIGALSAR
jgi:Bacterial extracellular solute-binding protein